MIEAREHGSAPMRTTRRIRRLLVLLIASPVTAFTAAGEVPAWIIDVPSSVQTVLVADTGAATLHEYRFDGEQAVAYASHYMSIGQNGAGKSRAGDRRTPLGTYFIVDQLDTARLHPKYGITAFPLDYPNVIDRRAGRTGDGIWLHGVDPDGGKRPVYDTDGCIALPNDQLETLAAELTLEETPVIIAREMRYTTAEEVTSTRQRLRAAVHAWRDTIVSGDVVGYLSLYAEEFSYRGLSRDEWVTLRASQRVEPPRSLEVTELLLLQDPEDATLYLARFVATMTSDGATTSVRKRLYWRLTPTGGIEIVAEDNG